MIQRPLVGQISHFSATVKFIGGVCEMSESILLKGGGGVLHVWEIRVRVAKRSVAKYKALRLRQAV